MNNKMDVEDQKADLSILDQITGMTHINPADEAYGITKYGIQTFINEVISEGADTDKRITQSTVDTMIAAIDRKLSEQLDAILHNVEFQKLESAWRSLKFLVDRTDFRENIKIHMLNVSKEKLLDDFDDASDITKSGYYKVLYSAEYGQFGGQPYGSVIGNYSFGPGTEDVRLLSSIASVSAMAHAPFIAAASSDFFGLDGYENLPNLKDLSSIFEGPQFVKWNAFRETDNAKYIGLTLPSFLLRVPYHENTVRVRKFNYTETTHDPHSDFLWGNAAFAVGTRITESFANYRWCANIIGPQGGGAIKDLPVYTYQAMGELQNKIQTEILISERREFELADLGFIALTMRKNSDNAAFFSANSVQKAKFFGNSKEDREAALNFKLSTQLPYVYIISRLAHYIKVIQRENVGTWKERSDLEAELNLWLRQYVADMDNPANGVRSRRPLRQASIEVSEVEDEPGWYKVNLKVRPHFKYMGSSFTLSLVGRLDMPK
ncbi:type VI secretion protein [Kosakonia radicincitans]|uniref:type VI secretion system contractile sheath large subunit n=1 Tax=Kosakonia radicincitans TaxID=283686 RepID=UPI000904208F|nr:type VI secretion system contractile sheath large subunit [Kosakonia radicincitans]APG19801.1 type VI secretion protein [Kosakonia radicincitans]